MSDEPNSAMTARETHIKAIHELCAGLKWQIEANCCVMDAGILQQRVDWLEAEIVNSLE